MPRFLYNPYLHGALTFAVFLALSIFSSNMNFGFVAALLLSAVSSWFRPCYIQFVYGAMLALTLSGLVSLRGSVDIQIGRCVQAKRWDGKA